MHDGSDAVCQNSRITKMRNNHSFWVAVPIDDIVRAPKGRDANPDQLINGEMMQIRKVAVLGAGVMVELPHTWQILVSKLNFWTQTRVGCWGAQESVEAETGSFHE